MALARKRFGQNFLTRRDIISKIIRHIDPKPGQKVVEIGPGRGALTGPLADSGAEVIAIEIDRDLAAIIRERHPAVNLINADVLKTDLGDVLSETNPARVVGNLPYNISTPLLFRLFSHAGGILDMHLMLQREVADRIVAAPGTPDYGRLSVMSAHFANARKLLEAPPAAFTPAPKVTSALVELVPRKGLDKQPDTVDPKILGEVVNQAFSMRRKTVRNALRNLLTAEELETLGIDPGSRPGDLGLAAYALCAHHIAARQAGQAGRTT